MCDVIVDVCNVAAAVHTILASVCDIKAAMRIVAYSMQAVTAAAWDIEQWSRHCNNADWNKKWSIHSLFGAIQSYLEQSGVIYSNLE